MRLAVHPPQIFSLLSEWASWAYPVGHSPITSSPSRLRSSTRVTYLGPTISRSTSLPPTRAAWEPPQSDGHRSDCHIRAPLGAPPREPSAQDWFDERSEGSQPDLDEAVEAGLGDGGDERHLQGKSKGGLAFGMEYTGNRRTPVVSH
jgi:hypothetical protein